MGRGAGQRRELCGVPGDAVQSLGDVGSALQDQILQRGAGDSSGVGREERGTPLGVWEFGVVLSQPRQPDLVVVGGPVQGLDEVSGSFQQHFLQGRGGEGFKGGKSSSGQ